MAYVVMAYTLMAYVVMAYIVMTLTKLKKLSIASIMACWLSWLLGLWLKLRI